MRERSRMTGAAIVAGLLAVSAGVTRGEPQPAASAVHDGQHDFDFLVGSWKIHLKRLVHRLANSHEWVEFDGTVVCRHIWGGLGEVEEFTVDSPEKNIFIKGVAVRLYNPKTGQWSIYWANANNGFFDPSPQVGQFRDGRGEFYGTDTQDGRPVFVRFQWTNTTSRAPHFEQAYSADGGRTWEVNWITEQTRVTAPGGG
jgi:hypothetical protein